MLPQDPIILLSYVNTQLTGMPALLHSATGKMQTKPTCVPVCRKWVIFTMPRRTVSSDFAAGCTPAL